MRNEDWPVRSNRGALGKCQRGGRPASPLGWRLIDGLQRWVACRRDQPPVCQAADRPQPRGSCSPTAHRAASVVVVPDVDGHQAAGSFQSCRVIGCTPSAHRERPQQGADNLGGNSQGEADRLIRLGAGPQLAPTQKKVSNEILHPAGYRCALQCRRDLLQVTPKCPQTNGRRLKATTSWRCESSILPTLPQGRHPSPTRGAFQVVCASRSRTSRQYSGFIAEDLLEIGTRLASARRLGQSAVVSDAHEEVGGRESSLGRQSSEKRPPRQAGPDRTKLRHAVRSSLRHPRPRR